MQSGSQIPPDFSIGYGTEIEESGGWLTNPAGLVILALAMASVVFLVQRKKRGRSGERVASGMAPDRRRRRDGVPDRKKGAPVVTRKKKAGKKKR